MRKQNFFGTENNFDSDSDSENFFSKHPIPIPTPTSTLMESESESVIGVLRRSLPSRDETEPTSLTVTCRSKFYTDTTSVS